MGEFVSRDSLDMDFSDYSGGTPNLIIGHHTLLGDGQVASIEVIETGRKIHTQGYTKAADPTPEEAHIVIEVNRRVDEFLRSPEGAAALEGGATRAGIVHVEMVKALANSRAQATKVAAATATPQLSVRPGLTLDDLRGATASPAQGSSGSGAEVVMTPEMLMERQKRMREAPPGPPSIYTGGIPESYSPASAINGYLPPDPVAQSTASQPRMTSQPEIVMPTQVERVRSAPDFSSLGIPLLGEVPFVPQYAKLIVDGSEGEQIRFRFHWGITVPEEWLILVYDSRKKPFKRDIARRLLNNVSSMANLFVGDTKELANDASPVRVIPPVQMFKFGCFLFVCFLQAE